MAQELRYETCLLVYNPIELTFDRPVIRLRRVRCPIYSVLVDYVVDKPVIVKINIGHTEGAAGIFRVIKTVLMPENSIIPTRRNFKLLTNASHYRIGSLRCVIGLVSTIMPLDPRSIGLLFYYPIIKFPHSP